MTSTAAQQVFDLYRKYGEENYLGEPVTQIQHAIQCAMQAEATGADVEVILGAFLHDVGHLVGMAQNRAQMVTCGQDLGTKDHDKVGEEYLAELGVPSTITSIVRGHVNAKRYLTYRHEDYFNNLSEASKMTLEHQGGPMTETEALDFEKQASFQTILQMRCWDEKAKDPDLQIEPLGKYESMLKAYMESI